MSEEYPPQVANFHETLESIPGVLRTDTTVTSLENITEAELGQLELADAPHAVLRRSPPEAGEVLIQTDISLSRDEAGWLALEFLAWAVKDLARDGQLIQLRPVALPPIVQSEVQIGRTLRLQLESFVKVQGSLLPVLDKLDELTEYLQRYLSYYGSVLNA